MKRTNKSDNNQPFSSSSSKTYPGKNEGSSSNNNPKTDTTNINRPPFGQITRRCYPFSDLNKSFRLQNFDPGLNNSKPSKPVNVPATKIPRPVAVTRTLPVESLGGDEEGGQLCRRCEEKKLRNVLQELSNIENGYIELLDKLARNRSELEIRSQAHDYVRKELQEKEMSFLTEINKINLNLIKLKHRKHGLSYEEVQATTGQTEAQFRPDDKRNKNFETNFLSSSPSISRSKMNKIMSNMKSDLQQRRRRRVAILEDSFGSGRSLESETKAELGYLPSSIRYFPEKKTLKYPQFHDDPTYSDDSEILEFERDSADTFEEIISRGRSRKSETSPRQSTPEVESLFHTSNSEIGDSSDTDSNTQADSGISGIVISSSEPNQVEMVSQNLQENSADNDLSADLSEELSAELATSTTVAEEELITRHSDYSLIVEAEFSEDYSSTGRDIYAETVKPAVDMTSDLTVTKQKRHVMISSIATENNNSPRITSSRELKALAMGQPIALINVGEKNAIVPERIRKLAQSILDINNSIAKHEKELKSTSNDWEDSDLEELNKMEIETEPEENFEEVPYYLLRSTLSSSSLDDQRDYSVIDFPLNRTRIPRPHVTKPQKINFEFEADISSLAVGQLDKGRISSPKKPTLKRISPRKTNLGPVSQSKPIQRKVSTPKPVSPAKLIQKPMSPLVQFLKKRRLKNPSTSAKPMKSSRSPKVLVRTPQSPKKSRKHSKATIASVLYPDRMEEVISLQKKDAARVMCREPFKINLLDLMDAIEERKRLRCSKPLGLSDIMDIKTLYKDIRKKEKEAAAIAAKALLNEALEGAISTNPDPVKVTNGTVINPTNQRNNPKRHTTPIPEILQPPLANYLKPCDRNPRNSINITAAKFKRNGPNNPNSSKVLKALPVKQMPSYLRFGMFRELRGRNPSQNLKGSTLTKNNVTNLLLRGLVPETLSFSNANKNVGND